jgi:hypothetical protein
LKVAAVRIVAATLALVLGRPAVGAPPRSVAAIERYAAPFVAKAAAREPEAIYANFASDGMRYVRYRTERALAHALAAFLAGPAPGGGSFIARAYRIRGSRGLLVDFTSAVQTSLTQRERVLFDGGPHAIWLHEEEASYNGFFRTVRDAYFAGGKTLADTTTRYLYAPTDARFAHPVKQTSGVLDDLAIPPYETRAELPLDE